MKLDKAGRSARERYRYEYSEARRIQRGRSKKHPKSPFKGIRYVALYEAERRMPRFMWTDKQRWRAASDPPDTHGFLAMIKRDGPEYRQRILEWWRRDLTSWINEVKKTPIQIPG